MGRYGMLNCRANFSMSNGGKLCWERNVMDNECRRINDCVLYRGMNLLDNDERLDFNLVYSEGEELKNVLKVILSMWDLEHGKNNMRTMYRLTRVIRCAAVFNPDTRQNKPLARFFF